MPPGTSVQRPPPPTTPALFSFWPKYPGGVGAAPPLLPQSPFER
ncbi:hypothetical protein D516_3024 [Rhodobacter sp. AKP1]|nr:hypothetical protein D516_3024 [Rhodobacter sp. AKP1]